MKIDVKDIPRIPRKLKKKMKKENRYTTKNEYIENYKERISMIQVGGVSECICVSTVISTIK